MKGFIGWPDPIDFALAGLGGPEIPPPVERRRVDDDPCQKLRLAILQGAVHDARVPVIALERWRGLTANPSAGRLISPRLRSDLAMTRAGCAGA
jgi:hypothetical protein